LSDPQKNSAGILLALRRRASTRDVNTVILVRDAKKRTANCSFFRGFGEKISSCFRLMHFAAGIPVELSGGLPHSYGSLSVFPVSSLNGASDLFRTNLFFFCMGSLAPDQVREPIFNSGWRTIGHGRVSNFSLLDPDGLWLPGAQLLLYLFRHAREFLSHTLESFA